MVSWLVQGWSRSRKDFQPEESESQIILTTPTPGRPFAHQLWLFVPQTCVSVTLRNISSLTLQQEMIMAIQKSYSALTCIPSLRGHSRSAASLRLITQPTLSQCNRSGLKSTSVSLCWKRSALVSLKISICSFWLALSLLCDVGNATVNKKFSWELVHCYVMHVTEQ